VKYPFIKAKEKDKPMFRGMRRKNQALSNAETIGMLRTCTSGVLAVSGDDNYPYAVPLSYAYKDGKLYFHAAKAGHKIDAIGRNNKVSFCVIGSDEVVAGKFTTHYRSAIVFGKARILTDAGERRFALNCLLEKYSPGFIREGQVEIEKDWDRLCVVEIHIEHMTGKAAIELIQEKVNP
jgi:hypothetical protein